ncbi:MAG: acyltransferase [Paludibacteraceae bacterium]
MMHENDNRIEWLDSVRAIAVIAVIVIHVSSPVVNVTFGKNMSYWWIGHIFDSAVRFAVPVFLMISGALLLSKKYDLKEFYKKRVARIFLPLLFFMIVYSIFRWVNTPFDSRPYGLIGISGWTVNLFVTEGISKHLWFVCMILFLYIFTPLVGTFIRKLKPEMVIFLLAAWVLLCFINNGFQVNMYSWVWVNLPKKIYIYFLYMGYMVLGYYFFNVFYVSKNIRTTALVLYLITVVVAVFMVYFASKSKSKLDTSFYSYLNLNTIIQASAVFIALKGTTIKNNLLKKVQQKISDYSFGIYLVHILVIGILYNHGIYWTMAHPLISMPILVILTLFSSMLIVYILRKLPYGKYISG